MKLQYFIALQRSYFKLFLFGHSKVNEVMYEKSSYCIELSRLLEEVETSHPLYMSNIQIQHNR